MASKFTGFSPKALTFLRQLKKNNEREWFQPRKALYEEIVRGPMLELTAEVCEELKTYAVDHQTDPAKAVFRIYRDTRFSKDKTPYKTHIAAHFPRRGLTKLGGAGYYFAVSPEGVEIAGGMYMPSPPELAAVRAAIAEDGGKSIRQILRDPKLKKLLGELQGDRLTRTPKGYDPSHPAADLLCRKQFYFFVILPAKTALEPGLRKAVCTRFRAVAPLVDYLNEAVLSRLRETGEEPTPRRPEPMF